jgi:hypothetical protein
MPSRTSWRITRREAISHWLGASAAAVSVAAATLPAAVFDASAPSTRSWQGQLRPDPQPALPQPKVLKSTDGELALTLTAHAGDGRHGCARAGAHADL